MSRRRKFKPTELYTIPAGIDDAIPTLATDDKLSEDGRRVKRTKHLCYAPPLDSQPSGSANADPPRDDLPFTSTEDAVADDVGHQFIADSEIQPRGQFSTTTHDPALLEWADNRQFMVHELLRHEGLGGAPLTCCPMCPPNVTRVPTYRCKDCLNAVPVCRECCVNSHRSHPFDRIERWNGAFFEPITLRDMGLVINLGHTDGSICHASVAAPRSFVVIHTNGMHPVNIQFCQCSKVHQSGTRVQQLMRFKLFPATLTDPSTCCTFSALKHFHTTTLQSKITTYDYYTALEKLTDNTGLGIRYDRVKAFFRMVREWRHLKSITRAGRGHELTGVKGTKEGDLCVMCPACPRPGYNLPDNWETISDDLKFIYTLFIAIDANFRLKRRAVSNETRDPALGSGWRYFVKDDSYREYLRSLTEQNDISTCTGFAALMNANNKFSKGYATTGVVMAVCSRHGFVLPNAAGDLQKGERYSNVDYVWASAAKNLDPQLPKVVSYDIACQWTPRLLERLQQLPDHLQFEIPEGSLRYAIPKYHFMGHKSLDHHKFSLNMMLGVGRTDGEEIERLWAMCNAIAASIREMGPGSRHDTTEDHIGWSNWLKLISLGKLLQRRIRAARVDAKKYKEWFEEFKEDLQEKHVQEWTDEVLRWENDTTLPDPYDSVSSGPSEAEIRAELAAEEEQSPVLNGSVGLHAVSPSGMLASLLDLEDQQRRLAAKYPRNANLTLAQSIEASEKRSNLQRRITALRGVQVIYMPVVSLLAARQERADEQNPRQAVPPRTADNASLFLPHSLTDEELKSCVAGLVDMEMRLREGQMRSALDTLRVHLHIKSRQLRFKNQNVRHQKPNTRAREKIEGNESKLQAAANKYRAAWNARKAVLGEGEWLREWRELKPTDVRCLREDDGGVTEGRRRISWIWMSADADDDDAMGEQSALRVEFLRARARALRFAEEVQILQEEQRRVLQSLTKNAEVWERRAQLAVRKECPILRQGAIAYAAKQGDLQKRLRQRFSEVWTDSGLTGNNTADANANQGNELDAAVGLFTISQDDSDDDLAALKGGDSDDDL